MSQLNTALLKQDLHLLHILNLLFPNGLAQSIGLALSEARQLLRQKHHLLLIYGNAVGFFEVFFHFRRIIGNGLAPELAVNIIGDIVHRPRTVEGVHGNEVFKAVGLKLAQPFAHALRLKLEHTHRLAAAKKLVGFFVF